MLAQNSSFKRYENIDNLLCKCIVILANDCRLLFMKNSSDSLLYILCIGIAGSFLSRKGPTIRVSL